VPARTKPESSKRGPRLSCDCGGLPRLRLDPVDGHLYLFLNKRRRLAKALWFDGSGWCPLSKRLEVGSFQLLPLDGDKPQIPITGSAFASLLAGIDFTAARRD
jgi:transposase